MLSSQMYIDFFIFFFKVITLTGAHAIFFFLSVVFKFSSKVLA